MNWKSSAASIAYNNAPGTYAECAKYVRKAIQAARGEADVGWGKNAKDCGSELTKRGYSAYSAAKMEKIILMVILLSGTLSGTIHTVTSKSTTREPGSVTIIKTTRIPGKTEKVPIHTPISIDPLN